MCVCVSACRKIGCSEYAREGGSPVRVYLGRVGKVGQAAPGVCVLVYMCVVQEGPSREVGNLEGCLCSMLNTNEAAQLSDRGTAAPASVTEFYH